MPYIKTSALPDFGVTNHEGLTYFMGFSPWADRKKEFLHLNCFGIVAFKISFFCTCSQSLVCVGASLPQTSFWFTLLPMGCEYFLCSANMFLQQAHPLLWQRVKKGWSAQGKCQTLECLTLKPSGCELGRQVNEKKAWLWLLPIALIQWKI